MSDPCCDNYPNYPIFSGAWRGQNRPKSSNCAPSPEPPWTRVKQNGLQQVISQNDTVSLTLDPTLLDQQINTPPAPVQCNLPDGSRVGQYKQIFVEGANVPTTETFIIVGTFTGGFTKLVFNSVGFSAVLTWTTGGWTLTGGNAELQA